MGEYSTTLPNGEAVSVTTSGNVFEPTYTSEMCIKAACKTLSEPGVVLDLGCGGGIVGIAIGRLFGDGFSICASDLSKEAVELALKNAGECDVEIDGRVGSCFEPWDGVKFDYIFDDVSGIAEPVAKISPWFGERVPCCSGDDGTELTEEILRSADKHLTERGVLVFPILSLSNHQKLIDLAGQLYREVELLEENQWKLPPEMVEHLPELQKLRNTGAIDFEEKFGMILCWTRIYRCMN